MNRPKTERLFYYDDIDIRLYLTEDPAITETTVVINPEGYISRTRSNAVFARPSKFLLSQR